MNPRVRVVAAVSAILFATLVGLPSTTSAQLAVNETWYTITTTHCRIHFTAGTEAVGRRAAAAAERAYANLARELVPPRGVVDVVVSDVADASNGAAGTFPRNRIIINARPPVDQTSLENYDDWVGLVMQHEMAHIFHLDRARGWWRAAQYVFGRNPVFFPNYYTPSWLTEGLAVYYESRYTTGGRLEGSYQYGVARAMARGRGVPDIDELALVTSRYPLGQTPYIYGSFLVDAAARHGGPASVRAFVERTSAEPIPFLLDRNAKRTFGETFTSLWRNWRDSVTRVTRAAVGPDSSVHVLPGGGFSIYHPRWLDAQTVVYLADNGRESQGLYKVSDGTTPVRVTRRASLDINQPTADGYVFAQVENVDRIYVRGDLYETRHGVTRRLTYRGRLNSPDANAAGTIVAVQTLPGTTRLALVTPPPPHSSALATVRPLMHASLDTQWVSPRWSPDGELIAAVRISAGINELVVLDTTGTVRHVLRREHAVVRSPAWRGDGRGVFYTSDKSGTGTIYYADTLGTGPGSVSGIALQWPDGGAYGLDAHPRPGVPDGTALTTTVFMGDGYHAAIALSRNLGTDTSAGNGVAYGKNVVDHFTPIESMTDKATPYSPWRTLLPTYWSPLLATGASFGTQVGAVTSGSDVVGRHDYVAQALVNTQTHHADLFGTYTYSRFVSATINAQAEQSWSYANVYSSAGAKVGRLDKVTRTYSLQTTFERPRAFTYASATFGAELETYDYATHPSPLLPQLRAFYQRSHRYPAFMTNVQFSNTQRPTLSISPEDGFAVSLTTRERWASGAGAVAIPSAVLSTVLFKSLDLPGFAHHVIAVRASAGATGYRSPSVYSVGGISGASFELVPGITIGDQARTFPVRGFTPGTEEGNVAISGSVEYRLPLSIPSRGLGLLPIFLDKTSLSLFGDVGRASCHQSDVTYPTGAASSQQQQVACSVLPPAGPTLTSVGLELNLDSALQFDVPYRFRFGVAEPLSGRVQFQPRSPAVYLTLGGSF